MTILFDSGEYSKAAFGASFDFMFSHGLIEVKQFLQSYKVVFVGEVLTPHHHFIALPKNFKSANEENVCLTIELLKEFRGLRKKGKLLIQNKSFATGKEIESEFFYWRQLYGFFMDYLTFEFYHPKQRLFKHSTKPVSGTISPLMTDINSERLGNGITYRIKDYSANPVRDIYYSVLKELEWKFASPIESAKISEMENFLKAKGFKFKEVVFEVSQALTKLQTTQFNPVHEVIMKTLADYLENTRIDAKNHINVFYSKHFEFVFQFMLQKVLGHNPASRTALWQDPNYKTLHPDLITSGFIGDAKYYNLENYAQRPFEKELYAYNVANGNSQNNLVIIPAEEHRHLDTLTHGPFRLEILSMDLKAIYKDFKNGSSECLAFARTIVDH